MEKGIQKCVKALPMAFVFFLLLILACNKLNKCDGLLCSTGPPSFRLELYDKETGQDVFTMQRFRGQDAELRDQNKELVYMQYVEADSLHFLNIALSNNEGEKVLQLKLDDEWIIPITLHVVKGESGCCVNYLAKDIQIDGYTYETSSQTGHIQVWL